MSGGEENSKQLECGNNECVVAEMVLAFLAQADKSERLDFGGGDRTCFERVLVVEYEGVAGVQKVP